jgi:CHAT domain-containing protein
MNRDAVKVHSQEYDSSFFNEIRLIRASVDPMALSKLNPDIFYQQQQAAYGLYRRLLEPGYDILEGKDLWVIPDDILGYVSFDLLLTSPPVKGRMDYSGLDYLIRNHQISYAYLATLSFELGADPSHHGREVVAFAPTYANLDTIPESRLISLRGMEKYLLPIRYAGEEMTLLSDLVDARIFREEQASESNFKRYAPDKDVIHLAMHTVIDDENPMFSKLAFTLGQEGEEDGLLNTYEIYGMEFDARLVVLSACNTGSGTLQRGEGIISLARAFMYAGVPGIVMTLWAVEDKSGYDIMEGFYQNLKQGMGRAEALRGAKLDYLAQADQLRSHPYFWAAYVSIGDDSPLYRKNKPPAIWIAGGLVVIVLIYLIYRARRRE